MKRTVRLLAVSAADPVAGPPWGMRVYSERLGEGCVQIGRLVEGNSARSVRTTPFTTTGCSTSSPPSAFGAKSACTLLDGNDRLFINATVGDLPGERLGGLRDGNVRAQHGRALRTLRRRRQAQALRGLPAGRRAERLFGLLGPDAKSITYVLDGDARTQPTVGAEGAYLIVTKASPKQLFNFSAGGTQDVVPVDGPITELHYRDGATCHLTARSWIGGKEACTPALNVPVGWVRPEGRGSDRRAGCLHAGASAASPRERRRIRSGSQLSLEDRRSKRAQRLHGAVARARPGGACPRLRLRPGPPSPQPDRSCGCAWAATCTPA